MFTKYEFETDDETQNALGQIVKQIEDAQINASGNPLVGGTYSEITTEYERQNDGRLGLRTPIRADS